MRKLYDESNRLTKKNAKGDNTVVTSFTYDAFDRLVKIEQGADVIENAYTADGKKLSRTTNGEVTYYVYDGNVVIEEQNEDNEQTARNVYGRNLITRETSDGIVVYAYNGHSDIIAICNIDGDALVVYEYDEFGNVTSETVVDEEFESFDNPYRYAGYEYIEEVKLYDLNARYYNPEIARFLSADPYYNLGNRVIGLYEINVPNVWSIIQANNIYVYCGNNSIVFFDPLGLEKIVVSGGDYSNDLAHSGYDYNFIEPAIKRIFDWSIQQDGEDITWVIANEGWSFKDKLSFNVVIDSIMNLYESYGLEVSNISIIYINKKDELIEYINNKDGSRSDNPISEFVVFSHGFDKDNGIISLGYDYTNSYNSSLDITTTDIDSIEESAFTLSPVTFFYSCNIGTNMEQSFANKWVNKIGGTTFAFVGQSYFGKMNDNEDIYNKITRKLYGFSLHGSNNYPVAGDNAYMKVFTR